jgi:transglutaminase/protease-like cytokinesis protein 3
MGADGRGGYGPHAWNEVKIGEGDGSWIPLDATWAASGDWFNPPQFEQTHIRDA